MLPFKQFIPQEVCLKCDGCCRFNYPDTVWAPSGRKTVVHQDYYICDWFNPQTHHCKEYLARPFDCLIYPFLLSKKDGKIYLSADLKCLYLEENFSRPQVQQYARDLYNLLKSKKGIAFLEKNPHLFIDYGEELKVIGELCLKEDVLGRVLCLNDKPLFDKYLVFKKHALSGFSFANIFIWQAHFDIRWRIIEDNLCVFFRGLLGTFMPLPPLGKDVNRKTIDQCFKLMDSQNKNPAISRIENIEEGDVDLYKKCGFKLYPKDKEYLYRVNGLITLSGDRFKSKRASHNYFIKHYDWALAPLGNKDISACLKILSEWKDERLNKNKDDLYRNILEDNFLAQKEALSNFAGLNLTGIVIKADNKDAAYSLGFELNEDVFCILAEAADLKFKGIAQFLFRAFCQRLKKYKYINAMDDSGLAGLRKLKLSYRPYKEITPYILERLLSLQ